jgi:hypothetical protein
MKATKVQIQLRIDDLVQFRLEGARFWDVRQYVTEKEKEPGSIWYRGENAKALSDATLWRYIRWADELIAEDTRSSRKKRLRLHIAKRQNLYAKAMSQGDTRTALAAADSEAKLLGLFPPRGVEMTGKDGGPIQHQATVVNVDLGARLAECLPAIRAAIAAENRDGMATHALPATNVPDAT